MADYIRRILAKAQFTGNFQSEYPTALIHALLDGVPSEDVRPVVRGHWITEEEAEAKGNYLLRDACSVCGHCDWDNTESKYFNYCPNCGAMMEES